MTAEICTALLPYSAAKFETCNFSNCDWSRAKLGHAVFAGCKLTGGNLSEVMNLGISFRQCALNHANLRGFSFRKAVLDGIDFTETDLTGADFRETEFRDCNLLGAILRQAKLQGADLRGAQMGQLSIADIAIFKGAIISRAQAGAIVSALGIVVM